MFLLLGRDPILPKRTRSITNWSVYDWGDGEYSVAGWVVNGDEPGDGEVLRSTRTSPIQNREGTNVVITESGSRYTLLDPHQDQDPAQILELFTELQN